MWGDSKVTITLQISREPNDILEDQSEYADPPASFSVLAKRSTETSAAFYMGLETTSSTQVICKQNRERSNKRIVQINI